MKKIILTSLALLVTACGGKAYADCIASASGTLCTDSRSKSLTMTARDIYYSNNAFIGMNRIDRQNQNNKWGCGSQNLVGYNSRVYNNEVNRPHCNNLTYNDLWHFGGGNGIYAQTTAINYKPISSRAKVIGHVKVTFDSSEWYGIKNSHPNNGSFFVVDIINAEGKILAQNFYNGSVLTFGSLNVLSISTDDLPSYELAGLQLRAKINYPNGVASYPCPVIHIHSLFLQAQDIGEANVITGTVDYRNYSVDVKTKTVSSNDFKKMLADLAKKDSYYRDQYLELYGELP